MKIAIESRPPCGRLYFSEVIRRPDRQCLTALKNECNLLRRSCEIWREWLKSLACQIGFAAAFSLSTVSLGFGQTSSTTNLDETPGANVPSTVRPPVSSDKGLGGPQVDKEKTTRDSVGVFRRDFRPPIGVEKKK
jgi:hypothetical protein